MNKLLGAATLVLGLPLTAAAQGVMVAPHAVFIDHRTRSGQVLLYNPNTEPAEVTISTLFGYPTTDSVGNIRLVTVERPDSTQPNASDWIQAFPRRLTLQPLERRTVRLMVRPPAGLADGEYWARLVIAAKGGAVPISGVTDTVAIRVGVTLEVRSILPLNYRKGNVATGIVMSDLRGQLQADSMIVRVKLERIGNAAFIGTVRTVLADSTGRVVAEGAMPLGVYYTLEPRIGLAVGRIAPGRYRLRVEATSQRTDIDDPRVLLPITPVRDSVDVRVP
jgi:hypothetical protein